MPVRRRVLVCLALYLFSLALYGLTWSREWPGSPDEDQRFQMASALADGAPVADALRRSRYGPLQSFVVWPWIKIADAVSSEKERAGARRIACTIFCLQVAALLPVLLYLLAGAIGIPSRTAIHGALLFAASSLLWPYSKRFYSEPLSAVLVMGIALAIASYERHRNSVVLFVAALLYGLVSAQVYTSLLLGFAIAGAIALTDRWRPERRFVPYLAILAAAILGVLAFGGVNEVRFGSWLKTGYEGAFGQLNPMGAQEPDFSTPLLTGLFGLLLSPGRGIVFFAPLVVVGLFGWKRLHARVPQTARFCALGALLFLFVSSRWWAWYGGECYGPRLLLPVLPLLYLPVFEVLGRWSELRRLPRGLVRLAAVWGICVAAGGSLFTLVYDSRYWLKSQYALKEHLGLWDPEYSILARLWPNLWRYPYDLDTIWLDLNHPERAIISFDPARPLRAVRFRQSWHGPAPWTISEMSLYDTSGRDLLRGPGAARVTVSRHAHTLPLALDGNRSTSFRTDLWRDPGVTFTIDLPSTRTGLTRLDLWRGSRWDEGPVEIAAEESEDGHRWQPIGRARVAGDARLLSLRVGFWGLVGLLVAATVFLLRVARRDPSTASKSV